VGRHKILLVDDNQELLTLLARLVEAEGWAAAPVNRGKAALERLSRKRYHAVVAGARMEGMDGIQLLAEARKSGYARDLPFILVASKEHREDLVRARAAGAKGCVTREEFTPDRMAAVIGSVLDRGAGG